ncbi:MAG: sigma-70 family RNA polymerase sigma factor [Acidimicrobiales bacterium]
MNEHTPEAEPTMAIADATQVGFDADADTGSQTAIRSFDEFYRSHRHIVARTLALTLGDEGLGQEAADEAMSRALERWSTVSAYDNPEGWVYRTGLNWSRSWLRRRRRGHEKDLLVALPATTFDRPVDTDLARAITRLSDDHRAVVVLRFYRDWSVEETADALDIAPGTVKSRLSRALDQLQHHLTNLDDEGPLR